MKKLVFLILFTCALTETANAALYFVCRNGQGWLIATIGNSTHVDGPSKPAGGCPRDQNYVVQLTDRQIKTSTGWVPPEVDDEVLTSINKADFKSEAQPDAETLAMLKQSSIPERYVDPEKLEPKVRNLLKKEMKEMNKEDR